MLYQLSIPWEWFHLLLENIIPNLVDLWTREFKGLDIGDGEFRIVPHIWKKIGEETATSVQHIPALFVHVLGNIATNCSAFTAESWCFWFVYLAPHLLANHFPKKKYYTHVCELGALMEITLQFNITAQQADDIEMRLQKWVEKYEKYVVLSYLMQQTHRCDLDITINIMLNVYQLAHLQSMAYFTSQVIFTIVVQSG